MPALPTEIVEYTIDSLAGDTGFLETCGNVCRSWRYRTLHHSYNRIDLRSQARVDSLAALLDANAELAIHIRDARIYTSAPVLRRLMPLPGVEKLTIHGRSKLPRGFEYEVILAHVSATFPNVYALTLKHCHVSSSDMSIQLAMSFPLLRNLHVQDLRYPIDNVSRTPSPSFKLASLKLNRERGGLLLTWLARGAALAVKDLVFFGYEQVEMPLEEGIGLDDLYREDFDGVVAFLAAADSKLLKAIRLTTPTAETLAILLEQILKRTNMASRRSLRTLSLFCDAVADPQSTCAALFRLIDEMCNVMPQTTVYTVGCFPPHVEPDILEGWPVVDGHAIAPVTFHFKGHDSLFPLSELGDVLA